MTCQQNKESTQLPLGLLQPSPLPGAIWEDMSVDFITMLPIAQGKSLIIVVIDQLSKYCHLGGLCAGYTTPMVVDFFVKNVVKLHGFPCLNVFEREHFLHQQILGRAMEKKWHHFEVVDGISSQEWQANGSRQQDNWELPPFYHSWPSQALVWASRVGRTLV